MTMKETIIACLLTLGVFAFSSTSHAGPYVSGYIGAAVPHESDGKLYGVSGEVEADTGVAAGLKAGLWNDKQSDSPYLGLELDLNAHFPEPDKLRGTGIWADADADVEVYSLTVNVLFRRPEGNIKPYAGAGIGWFYMDINDPKVKISGIIDVPVKGDDDTSFGWQLLAGIDLSLNPEVSVFVEYKYSRADFEFEIFDVDYEVSQAYAGISYHF